MLQNLLLENSRMTNLRLWKTFVQFLDKSSLRELAQMEITPFAPLQSLWISIMQRYPV